jgi:hypothetical protein
MKDGHTNSDPGHTQIFDRLKKFINEGDLKLLVDLPTILALAILFVWIAVNVILEDGLPKPLSRYIISLAMIISSISGLVLIVRQEMPGPLNLRYRGKIVVAIGVAVFVLSWIVLIVSMIVVN